MKEKVLGIRDTLLLGILGGLWIASLYIVPDLFYGMKSVEAISFWDSAGDIVLCLLVMSFIEYRMSKREEIWRKVRFAFAFAGALGFSIICGYTAGVSAGLLRFVALLPIALFTVWLAGLLLATPEKKDGHN